MMRMIAPLRAAFTAAWMCRKRHFLSWRRRRLRFFVSCLPLKERLISFFELVLQTVRIWSAFARTGGT